MAVQHRGVIPILWWLSAMLLLAGGAALAVEEPDNADVRVLIDISGSMRQNDPNNLRRPALRMLAGLLQPGTRAGVWTFARWVNNLVPVAEVDTVWKKRSQSLSKQISSPGQFTNIEEVLDAASLDWNGETLSHARHLILLTDGMVDVSQVAGENAASRSRILQDLLPRLKADQVKVHTIALSERADHALMKKLAGETGGWYQQVEKAEDLQRIFLRMFEKVGKPDTVPLEGNRFVVDGAVDEATVLAFRQPDAPPTKLVSPSGEEFSDSDLPSGVAWFRDEGYDMVTISGPEKGEWVLKADLDPDNRVMIVTQLKLQTSEIPTHAAVGEDMLVEANLKNNDKVVTREAFLRLLEVNATVSGVDGLGRLLMNDAGQPPDANGGDGVYATQLLTSGAVDDVELLVTVESPTFTREKRFRLTVHEPVDAMITEGPNGSVLRIELQRAVMAPGASVDVWQEIVPGEKTALDVQQGADGEWSAVLQDTVSPSYVKVVGTTLREAVIDRTVGPIMPAGVAAPVVVEPPPKPVAPVEPAPLPEPETEPSVVEPVAAPLAAEPEPAGWVMPAVIFGLLNFVLIVAGVVWFILRRRRTPPADAELDDLIAETTEAAATDRQESAA